MVLAGDAMLIVTLHGLGTTPLFQVDWTSTATWRGTDPIPVLADLGRMAALVVAYWVVAVLVAHVAQAGRRRGVRSNNTFPAQASQIARTLTLPALRRLAERAVGPALAVSVLASSTLTPTPAAAADDAPPIPVVVEVDIEAPLVETNLDDAGRESATERGVQETEPGTHPAPPPGAQPGAHPEGAPTGLPGRGASTTPAQGVPFPGSGVEVGHGVEAGTGGDPAGGPAAAGMQTQDQPSSPQHAATSHIVRPGDCIWDIAVGHLRSVDGSATAGELARYWAETVAANHDSIRSGDPDLIFPGETIRLPEIHR